MRRLVLVLAVALACVTGTARADTFGVVPNAFATLPSADVPNLPGQAVPPSSDRCTGPAQTDSKAVPSAFCP